MKATLLITLALVTALPLPAADPKPEPPIYLAAAEGGRDYVDQGEYVNDWGGAQVIALGADGFRLVTYKGGLPGAGWDKESRREVEGKRDGDSVRFDSKDGYTADLSDGTLTIKTSAGGPYTMKKTVRTSPTLGAKPPAGATILFDGTNTDEWAGGRLKEDGLLAAGSKTKNAVLTAKHNGVVIHESLEIDGPPGGGQPETAEPGAIQLQGHGNPVFYRNIWIAEK